MTTNTKFILIYKNGSYVQRDDSSGGYPFPTKDLWRATRWERAEDAYQYAQHFLSEILPYAYPVDMVVHDEFSVAFEDIVQPATCNHNCKRTPEALHRDARHYLDCLVWDFK